MERKLKLRTFAKANLSLNITGKRDGMHTLDSVMISLDCFDTVTVTERGDSRIEVVFRNADIGADNTAYRAARAVQEKIGGGWDIDIEKGIPVGAGLGGSSADAAAVLRALDVMYKLPERGVNMREVALSVGSDVPFMLTGGLARVEGIGEELFFMENKLTVFAVGIMCGEVSTKRAYELFDELYPSHRHCPTDNFEMCEYILDGYGKALELVDNALYAPAVRLVPEIADAAALLRSCGAHVSLTGSGGMVLGYFTDIAKLSACVETLRGKRDFRVFTSVKTGVLHEWL
ncbi:MAG: hypothetical protein NC184_07220 [Roseburia sp.]|nr:hypothetical protein [Roseburia sp.]